MRFVLLAVAITVSADPVPEPSAKDREALQGTWVIRSMEVGGKTWSKEALEKAKLRIVVSGDRIKFLLAGREAQEATFTLDPARSPAHFDTVDARKRVEKGIYELKGDTLRICAATSGEERPTAFASSASPSTALYVFEREKP